MRIRLLAILCLVLASCIPARAADTAPIKVGVLKFGTVNWVMDTIQANGFDKAEGISLDVVALASTQGTTVGLQGGSLDIVVTDWLYVSRERTSGGDFTFVPFSTALGAIMVPPDSPIKTLSDLKGKTLGVAGGPLDKSWLLIVAYALRTAGIDLRTETTQEFGAPPLLSARAVRGQIDAVLNFWPYAARLEAVGFTQLIGLGDVVQELGARGEVAMLGYVFNADWAEENPGAIDGFIGAAAKANNLLATSDAEWDRLKPVMRANDPTFNEATFDALRRHFREGIPERQLTSEEADAKILYQFLRELGGTKLVGPGTELAPGTFWHGTAQ